MKKKKTAETKQRSRFTRAKNKYVLIGSICAMVVLGFTTLAGPWATSLGSRRIGSLFSPPPVPVPSPANPSKEYIYAGGRLVATEEPSSVVLTAPTNLVADTFDAARVDLTWSAAPNAHHYQVERASNLGGTFTVLNSNVATTSYTDNTVTSVNAYLYRVRSADASNNLSSPGSTDVATAITFTDNPLTAGSTLIKAQHITELRQAVDAVRVAANLGVATWTDSSLSNMTIKAVHIQELRTNLDQALNALSITPGPYTDSSLTGIEVKKVHVDELRQRVE